MIIPASLNSGVARALETWARHLNGEATRSSGEGCGGARDEGAEERLKIQEGIKEELDGDEPSDDDEDKPRKDAVEKTSVP